VDVSAINKHFGKTAWQKQAQEISDRGVTLLRDTPRLLPLDASKPPRALLLAFYADPEPYPGEDLERELRRRCDSVTTVRADTRFRDASNLKLPPPDSYDVAILALFVRCERPQRQRGCPGGTGCSCRAGVQIGQARSYARIWKPILDRAIPAG